MKLNPPKNLITLQDKDVWISEALEMLWTAIEMCFQEAQKKRDLGQDEAAMTWMDLGSQFAQTLAKATK